MLRVKRLEKEVEQLRTKLEIMDSALTEIVTAYKDIRSDMKEHDDEFEKFLDGMSNMMNYSYTTALEAEKHE